MGFYVVFDEIILRSDLTLPARRKISSWDFRCLVALLKHRPVTLVTPKGV